jgi:DNA-binding transcriptional LysR family regulator
MSTQLKKLRTLFNDPLFTREKYGISPTQTAQRLAAEISSSISALDALVLEQQTFKPSTSTDTFTLAVNDYFEALIMPRLISRLQREAPHVQIKVAEFTQNAHDSQLMSSNIHLAFGRISAPPDNLVCQTACTDTLSCLICSHSWETGDELTREEYESREHIVVKPSQRLITGVFSMLSDAGITRKIKCEVSHFHYLPALLLNSNYIATVPTHIGEQLSNLYPLTLLSPPDTFPHFPFHLAWHQRYQRDPAHQWLRQSVKAAVQEVVNRD